MKHKYLQDYVQQKKSIKTSQRSHVNRAQNSTVTITVPFYFWHITQAVWFQHHGQRPNTSWPSAPFALPQQALIGPGGRVWSLGRVWRQQKRGSLPLSVLSLSLSQSLHALTFYPHHGLTLCQIQSYRRRQVFPSVLGPPLLTAFPAFPTFWLPSLCCHPSLLTYLKVMSLLLPWSGNLHASLQKCKVLLQANHNLTRYLSLIHLIFQYPFILSGHT